MPEYAVGGEIVALASPLVLSLELREHVAKGFTDPAIVAYLMKGDASGLRAEHRSVVDRYLIMQAALTARARWPTPELTPDETARIMRGARTDAPTAAPSKARPIRTRRNAFEYWSDANMAAIKGLAVPTAGRARRRRAGRAHRAQFGRLAAGPRK